MRSALARGTTAPAGTWSNDHAVGWVHDRLVLLIPAHAVMLVSFAAEHLDDLSSARRLAVHAMRLNPVTYVGAGFNGLIRHQFTSFDAIKPLGPQLGIGDRAKPAAVIYGCAPQGAGAVVPDQGCDQPRASEDRGANLQDASRAGACGEVHFAVEMHLRHVTCSVRVRRMKIACPQGGACAVSDVAPPLRLGRVGPRNLRQS